MTTPSRPLPASIDATLALLSAADYLADFSLATVLFAASMWAAGSFSMTKLSTPADPLASTAMQMLCGGALMVAVSLVAGCAALPPEEADAKQEKVYRTGSNLPQKDRRPDVVVLDPAAVQESMTRGRAASPGLSGGK